MKKIIIAILAIVLSYGVNAQNQDVNARYISATTLKYITRHVSGGHLVFVNPSNGRLYASDSIPSWIIGGGGGVSYWTLSGSNLYPNSLAYDVAIGSTNANGSKLYVNGKWNLNDGYVKYGSGYWWVGQFSGLYGRYAGNQTYLNGMLDESIIGRPHVLFIGFINDTANIYSYTHRRIAMSIDTVLGIDLTSSNLPGKPNLGIHISCPSLSATHVIESDITMDTVNIEIASRKFNSLSQNNSKSFWVTPTGIMYKKHPYTGGETTFWRIDTTGYMYYKPVAGTSVDSALMMENGIVKTIAFPAGGSGWSLTGNSGTDPSINFVGTIDNQPLFFRTNNIVSGEINPSGQTFLGSGSGRINTGTDNTGIGNQTLYDNITGNGNVAIGTFSLHSNTANYNTGVGNATLTNNIDGANNIAIGYSAGSHNKHANSRLYINSFDRTDSIGDSTKSIIFGIQNVDQTLQELWFNASIYSSVGHVASTSTGIAIIGGTTDTIINSSYMNIIGSVNCAIKNTNVGYPIAGIYNSSGCLADSSGYIANSNNSSIHYNPSTSYGAHSTIIGSSTSNIFASDYAGIYGGEGGYLKDSYSSTISSGLNDTVINSDNAAIIASSDCIIKETNPEGAGMAGIYNSNGCKIDSSNSTIIGSEFCEIHYNPSTGVGYTGTIINSNSSNIFGSDYSTILSSTLGYIYGGATSENNAIIGGREDSILGNVRYSVILGGFDINATKSYTAYMQNSNIKDTLFSTSGIRIMDSLYVGEHKKTLADEASAAAPTAIIGRGWVSVCSATAVVEWADFYFDADGTTHLIQNSGNVVITDTDGKFCIIDSGSGFSFKNRLGSQYVVKYRIEY